MRWRFLPGGKPQRRVARDCLEVGVFAEQLGVIANRDNRDQAVSQLARRVPSATAESIQIGGVFVVVWTVDGKKVLTVEKPL